MLDLSSMAWDREVRVMEDAGIPICRLIASFDHRLERPCSEQATSMEGNLTRNYRSSPKFRLAPAVTVLASRGNGPKNFLPLPYISRKSCRKCQSQSGASQKIYPLQPIMPRVFKDLPVSHGFLMLSLDRFSGCGDRGAGLA
jgi:hypothetical protein